MEKTSQSEYVPSSETATEVYDRIKSWPSFIRSVLQNLNISQLQLAKTLNVAHPTISRWIKGKSIPRREQQNMLFNLCEQRRIMEKVLMETQGPIKVQLYLSWKNSAQFAGFYSAVRQGYYEKAGLDVDIFEGGFSPRKTPVSSILGGKSRFGITRSLNLVYAREKGERIKAVATIFQKNPACLIYIGDGVDQNLVIGIPKPDATERHNFFEAALLAQDRKFSSLKEWRPRFLSGSDLEHFWDFFKRQEIRGLIGFTENESEILKNEISSPEQIREVCITDRCGKSKIYGDVLFTTEDLIKDRPKLVEAFVHASIKGWKFSLAEKDVARDHIEEYIEEVGRYRDMDHQGELLKNWESLIRDGEGKIGTMKEENWLETIEVLKTLGEFEGISSESNIEASQCFDARFVSSYYEAKKEALVQ